MPESSIRYAISRLGYPERIHGLTSLERPPPGRPPLSEVYWLVEHERDYFGDSEEPE